MYSFNIKTFLAAFYTSFFIGEAMVFLLSSLLFFPVFKSHWGGISMSNSPAQHAFLYMALFHLIFSLLYGLYITFCHQGLKKLQLVEKTWTISLYLVIIGFLTSVILILIGIIPSAMNEYTTTVAMGPGSGHVVDAVFVINIIFWLSLLLYVVGGTIVTMLLLKHIPPTSPKVSL